MRAEKRVSIHEQSNWRCCYCGVRTEKSTPPPCSSLATIDHIECKKRGGSDKVSNLVSACAWCNEQRDTKDALVWFRFVQIIKAAGLHPHFGGPPIGEMDTRHRLRRAEYIMRQRGNEVIELWGF